jgi:hypothetical protein
MKKEEVQALAEIRRKLIYHYKQLDGKGATGTALMKQEHTAGICEEAIRALDGVLKNHVSFE